MLDGAGTVIADRAVLNDERVLEGLFVDAGDGAAVVIDQPGSIGMLAIAVARRRGIPGAPRPCESPSAERPSVKGLA